MGLLGLRLLAAHASEAMFGGGGGEGGGVEVEHSACTHMQWEAAEMNCEFGLAARSTLSARPAPTY
jgi:hypothetical protein